MGRTVHSSYVDLDPTDYTYIDSFDAYPDEDDVWFASYGPHPSTLLEGSSTSIWGESGQCDHCGARIRYVVVMKHEPTDSYMAIGEQCYAERFHGFDSKVAKDIDRLRKRAAAGRALAKVRKAVDEWLEADPDNLKAVEYAEANREGNYFYTDLLRKLKQYGPWSVGQRDAVLKGIVRDAERAAREAERETEVKAPCPTGKVTVTGEVIKLDTQDGYLPGDIRYVMTVKDDTGFLVWGTRPSALSRVEKGDRVTFSATVEQSDRDECFGFYKRPTKASVL